MEKDRRLAFAFVVYKIIRNDGKIDFKIKAENKELPDEMMLTMMRHWLKEMEQIYQNSLPSKYYI